MLAKIARTLAHRVGKQAVRLIIKLAHAFAERLDLLARHDLRAALTDQVSHMRTHGRRASVQQQDARIFWHVCVFDCLPDLAHAQQLFNRNERPSDLRQTCAFFLCQLEWMDQAQSIDYAVGKFCCDQLIAQPVAQNLFAKGIAQWCRKCFDQHWLKRLVAHEIALFDCVLQNQLC